MPTSSREMCFAGARDGNPVPYGGYDGFVCAYALPYGEGGRGDNIRRSRSRRGRERSVQIYDNLFRLFACGENPPSPKGKARGDGASPKEKTDGREGRPFS